jgi:8-oxo-dGTP pyrophosphatase MutT (NUDIX family)
VSAARINSLSVAHIRQRLSATRLPVDPMQFDMQRALQRWPRALLKKYASKLQPAGVLVPIIVRDDSLSVLLTQRAAGLSQHAGQVSFPGGRMELGDADVMATALRETYEEIGIAPQLVDVVGYLDTSPTVSGYAVTPVIGFVASGYRLDIDRAEVEQVFEVPLNFLLQAGNVQMAEREVDGFRMPVAEFHYGERRVWGATANILVMLLEKLT